MEEIYELRRSCLLKMFHYMYFFWINLNTLYPLFLTTLVLLSNFKFVLLNLFRSNDPWTYIHELWIFRPRVVLMLPLHMVLYQCHMLLMACNQGTIWDENSGRRLDDQRSELFGLPMIIVVQKCKLSRHPKRFWQQLHEQSQDLICSWISGAAFPLLPSWAFLLFIFSLPSSNPLTSNFKLLFSCEVTSHHHGDITREAIGKNQKEKKSA